MGKCPVKMPKSTKTNRVTTLFIKPVYFVQKMNQVHIRSSILIMFTFPFTFIFLIR